MKDGLELIYALQLLDDKIKDLEISFKEIPAIIKKLETERDGKASVIQTTKDKLKQNIKEREKLEKEILQIREKTGKYKDQMNKATTNKEYQGFIAEIKYEDDHIITIEEKIIEKMLESDEILKEITVNEDDFIKISGDYNKRIEELKKTIDNNKQLVSELRVDKDALRPKIHAKLLVMYDVMARKKTGVAVALVETEFCGACNVKIRPQRINELLSSTEISFCESCGRILYKKPIVEKETMIVR